MWAQVKAKQDAMFVDSSLLKVDQGVLSSAKVIMLDELVFTYGVS